MYWDPTGALTPSGGNGTWDTTSNFWLTAATGGTLQTYTPNSDPSTVTANFAGTAGTVTIAAGTSIFANALTFGTTGYILASASGGSLTLSGTTPTITGNGTTTFTTKINGTGGFTLNGGSFNVFAGDLTGLTGTINVNARATLQGYAYGGSGVTAAVLTGSQNQTWNVSDVLTSNNQGAGSTIQLGAITGAGTIRVGNNGSGATTGGTDIFQVGALNTSTTFSGTFQDVAPALAGLTKVGTGNLTLTGASTHTGGTIVNGGTLTLGIGGANGALRGAVTVNSGGTLSLAANNALGYGTTQITTLNVVGGTVNIAATATGDNGFTTNFNLTGGTMSTSTTAGSAGYHISNGYSFTSNASGTTSLISAPIYLRSGTIDFNVAKGTVPNSGPDLSITGQIRDVGTLNKTGLGVLSLTAANTYTGNTTVNGGTLSLGAGGAAGTVRGTVTVNGSATLNLAGGDALGYSAGNITAVNVNGGTVTSVAGNNEGFLTNFNLTGGTVSAGSLYRFNVNATTPPGIASLTSGTTSTFAADIDAFPNTNVAGTLGISVATGTTQTGVDLAISGIIRNTGGTAGLVGITKTGLGTLSLTGNNTFTGPTNINVGTVIIGGGGGLYTGGTVSGAVNVASGATLQFNRNDSLGDSSSSSPVVVTVAGGTLASNNSYTSLNNPVFNGATITDNGGASAGFNAFRLTGTVVVGGTAATNFNAGATNAFTGINIGGNFVGTVTTTFNVDNATGNADSDLNVNVPVLNTNTDNTVIGALTKSGVGTMSLNAVNTYTGATTVSAGTLLVNGSTAGGSVVTVNNAGSVLGGGGTIAGATTINTGAKITAADIGTVGALTLSSTVTINGGTFAVDISGATADRLNITGALSLTNANITFTGTPTAASYTLATFASVSGSFAGTAPGGYAFQFNSPTNPTELDLVAVPEPATWLAGFLLFGLVGVSQRRKIGAVLAATRAY